MNLIILIKILYQIIDLKTLQPKINKIYQEQWNGILNPNKDKLYALSYFFDTQRENVFKAENPFVILSADLAHFFNNYD